MPQRKSIRIKDYDYSSEGYYFITICTQNRECILSKIIEYEENNVKPVGVGVLDDPKIENIKIKLLKPGEFIKKQIQLMNKLYKDIKIIDYVIMPNHIHLIIEVIQRVVGDADPYKYENSIFNIYIKEIYK